MNDGSLIDVTALKRNARNRIEAMYESSSVNVKFETRSSTFTNFTFTRDNSYNASDLLSRTYVRT